MSFFQKKTIPGRLGHTIVSFVIFSDSIREEPSITEEENVDNDGSIISNDGSLGDNDNHDLVHTSSSDTIISKDYKSDSLGDFSLDDLCYYKEHAKIQNQNFKNNVAYNRIVANIDLDETKRLLYGTWDPEQSEEIWNNVNGDDSEEDGVFTDMQLVVEEDIIKPGKVPNILLSTNHIRDFVKYDVREENEEDDLEPNFRYNRKMLLMFGGAFPSDCTFLDSLPLNSARLMIQGDLDVTNDLYVSHVDYYNNEWTLLDCANNPESRAFHASCIIYATLDTPILIVHGGFGAKRKLLPTELHILNLNSKVLRWERFLTNGPLPPERYGHSISHVGNYLVIFGGTNGKQLFHDIWVLDINNGIYVEPGKLSANCWTKLESNGFTPSPRAFHSCTKIGISSNSPMVVYGGEVNEEQARSRIYALHAINDERIIWTILPVYVKCPSETRAFHSMAFIDRKFVITGGIDLRSDGLANLRSLIYSVDSKTFHYCDDTISTLGHQSWSAFGIIYHWGGLSQFYGKNQLDNGTNISNPIFYSNDRNIEEIYFNFIQQKTLQALQNDIGTDDALEFHSSTEKEPQELDPQIGPEIKQPELLDEPKEASPKVEVPTFKGRPRRSAAIKCLNAIELDNLKRIQANKNTTETNTNSMGNDKENAPSD